MDATAVQWRTLLAASIVIGATLVSGGTAVANDQPGTSESIPTERPAENAEQRVTLRFHHGSPDLGIAVFVAYPARNEAEADAAREGTLDPEWLSVDERLRSAHDRIAADDERIGDRLLSPSHSDRLAARSPREPEHGWIVIHYDNTWRDFTEPGEEVRIGEAFVDAFGPNWRLKVAYPTPWEPEVVSGDPHPGGTGMGESSFTWDLSNDPESPLIVFPGSETQTEDEDTNPLGPAGGIGPAVLALLIVVLGATAHRLRADD